MALCHICYALFSVAVLWMNFAQSQYGKICDPSVIFHADDKCRDLSTSWLSFSIDPYSVDGFFSVSESSQADEISLSLQSLQAPESEEYWVCCFEGVGYALVRERLSSGPAHILLSSVI